MKILDLFSGLGGWSEAFLRNGWDVMRIDNNPRFANVPNTLIQDIRNLVPETWHDWNVILLSPPCQFFSVTNIGKFWHEDHSPRDIRANEAWELVKAGLALVAEIRPKFWWMENPRAKLRRLMEISYPEIPRVTVTYCQYGGKFQKPTDLWGWWPANWNPRPTCGRGAPCHIRQPRGANAGSQGGGIEGALIPYQLSDEVRLAVESTISD